MIVREPPEPGDILWENLGTPFSILLKTRLVTFLLVVLILTISFFVILGLKFAQMTVVSRIDNNLGKTSMSLLITIVLTVVNSVLGIVLRKISSYEKYVTLTDYNSSVARRVSTVSYPNSIFQTYSIHPKIFFKNSEIKS